MSLVATNCNSTTTPLPQTVLDHLTDVKATANKTASNISEPTATTGQPAAVPEHTATVIAIVAQSTSETINFVDLSTAETDVETATTVSTATTLPTTTNVPTATTVPAATNVPTATTVPAATTLSAETVLTAATNGDEENKLLLLLIGGKDAAGKPYTSSELVGQYRYHSFPPIMDTQYTRQKKLYEIDYNPNIYESVSYLLCTMRQNLKSPQITTLKYLLRGGRGSRRVELFSLSSMIYIFIAQSHLSLLKPKLVSK
jgi:hypothetical protein